MASMSHLRIASFPSLSNNSRKLLPSLSSINHLKTTSSCSVKGRPIKCMTEGVETSEQTQVVRRSANYKPSIWNYSYIQSLKSDYLDETCKKRVNYLKGEVRMMLDQVMDPIHQLELIDVLQRLGLAYHFDNEIDTLLMSIFCNDEYKNEKDLHAAALGFRLLRQHGFNVPQEIFIRFLNESTGNFSESFSNDTKGLLSLYEVSYLSIENESILEKAREFATAHLQEHVNDQETTIKHALELPLHWRMPRLESRWFIDVYEKREDKNHILLELAKLDYNMVQAIHQEDLKHMSRWWSNTGLAEKLSFSRDRLMENYLWTVGVFYEPQFGYDRRMLTQINALITTIDDVYDIYGSLEELKLFTDAVERWDINAIEQLPDYMQICFLALYNSINEMAYDAMKQQGICIISYLKKSWADLCKAYMLEAEWYYSGYKPSLQQYIDNAWISISAPLILVHVYFFVTNPVTKEGLVCLEKYQNIIHWSSMILRLANDLGTSSEELQRGDVPKSIQCYMNESGASEEEARDHIRHLINVTWNKMNEDRVTNLPFSRDFIRIAMNLARMAQCMYQHGDGHASQDQVTKDRVLSMLIQPIKL
uniref:Terpene synthase n=1 Tax=Pelargonium graveolens TaxID=73200 RepID=A0A2S1JL02_9ROSI|nr:terpene synthase [Pelargonium graveolens]